MYYKEERPGRQWIATLMVSEYESYLKTEITKYSGAEIDQSFIKFKFIQPNGILQLKLEAVQQRGWTVHPHDPATVCPLFKFYFNGFIVDTAVYGCIFENSQQM